MKFDGPSFTSCTLPTVLILTFAPLAEADSHKQWLEFLAGNWSCESRMWTKQDGWSQSSETRQAEDLTLDAAALRRFEALRAFRLTTAQSEGVPPYVVASDRSLRELAVISPVRKEDLTLAHGIGEAKAEKYGDGFLRVLNAVRDGESAD